MYCSGVSIIDFKQVNSGWKERGLAERERFTRFTGKRKSFLFHKSHFAWKVSVFGYPVSSAFSPNAGKYGPKKLLMRTLFR